MSKLGNVWFLGRMVILAVLSIAATSCQDDKEDFNFVPVEGLVDWERILIDNFNDLHDVYFVSATSGWAVGDNGVFYSTSGGDIGWTRAPVNLPNGDLRSVFFLDNDIGWIAGDVSDSPRKGQIAFTSMGGGYPIQQHISENPLNTVFFINDLEGWSGGENGLVIHTFDGGNTWETLPAFSQDTINEIYFIDETKGWIATSGGQIFRTNNGETWESTSTGVTSNIMAIHFLDEFNGWACGDNNTILKWEEDDGVMVWRNFPNEQEFGTMLWTDIFFISESTGWIIGDFGRVYKSIDGGMSWTREESSSSTTLNSIFMISSDRGYIVGDNGVIMTYNPR